MDGPGANDLPLEAVDDHNTILRVSHPWPARTKKALRASLDHGIFEDIRVTASSGSESREQPMHFAGAVDEGVGTSIPRREPSNSLRSELMMNNNSSVCRSESASQQGVEISLSTWVKNVHSHFLAPNMSQLEGNCVLHVHRLYQLQAS